MENGPVVEGQRPSTRRGIPPEHIFVPLTEQLANVRRWNEDREWGFTSADFEALDLTPRAHVDPLVVDLLAVYLRAEFPADELDGVRRTCHELWDVASDRQPNSWSWDWMQPTYYSHRKPVRLLSGIEHQPGLRRVSVDLGAHWLPGRHVRPQNLRQPSSAHAEILAAAAHFPRWAQAMDGVSVPFVWLAGYQVTFPEDAVNIRLPCLAWVRYRRTLSLTVDWADRSHTGFAAPVCIR
jgi:hypothetical protein